MRKNNFYLFTLIILFQIMIQASPAPSPINVESLIQETGPLLQKESEPKKHAEILKRVHTQLLTEINKTSPSQLQQLERQSQFLIKMNVLFLDSFNKARCGYIKTKWASLTENESPDTYENKTLNGWIQTICAK